MLQKDPKKRATAKACLEHSWIVMGGCMGQEKPHSNQLTSAQENMKKFQEQYITLPIPRNPHISNAIKGPF